MSETLIDPALEAEFALRRRHPERESIYDGHRRLSAALRDAGHGLLNQRYGAGPRCLLDVFPADPGAPVLFFIHGGYWRALDKSDVSFIAEPYVNAGITVVTPGYDLVPHVRVADILDEMRAALAWVMDHLAPPRIVVGGHSAGGQLAAMLALDQVESGIGPICGLAGISGAFDLRPLRRTSINVDLALSEAEAAAASPLVRLAALPASATLMPLLAAVGAEETAGFKTWSRDLAALWHARGGAVQLLEPARRNHFTILDLLADREAELTRGILALAETRLGGSDAHPRPSRPRRCPPAV